MDLLNGLDGQYTIINGKLVKLLKEEYSENFCAEAGGWVKREFEPIEVGGANIKYTLNF